VTKKAIDKKIKTMELLNIAYDSNEIQDSEVSEIYEENFVAKLFVVRGHFFYKVGPLGGSLDSGGRQCLLDYTNKRIKNFYLRGSSYNLPTEYDKFTIKILFKNKEFLYESNPSNTLEFNQFLFKYIEDLPSIPKSISFSVHIHRTTSESYRQQWFEKCRGDSVDNIMSKIFCPKVDDSRIQSSTRKSRYCNPFSGSSLKARLYYVNKEVMVFTIEYLYGKKINKSLPTKDISKILRGLSNTRFGINDVQVAKKLPGRISEYSVEKTFKGLMSLGIKPATDLKRWTKKYNLTYTKES